MKPDELILCLAEERQRQGLSLRDVAGRTPVLSASTLLRLERGYVSPSLHQLDAWAAPAPGVRRRTAAPGAGGAMTPDHLPA